MKVWAGLAIGLLLVGCADDTPLPVAENAAPLDFAYLTKLRLNVATVTVDDSYVPSGPGEHVEALAPVPPAELLRLMARERVLPGGAAGTAKVTIEDASIVRTDDQLEGSLAVRLDVANGDGTQTGFADARIARSRTMAGEDSRVVAGKLERQMMADMNVEFEYQVRKSLKDWLQVTAPEVPPAAAIQSQDLPPPPGS